MNNTTVAALRGHVNRAKESFTSFHDFVESFVKASGLNGNDVINFPLLFGNQEKTSVFIDGISLNHEQLRIFNMVIKRLRSNQEGPFQIFVCGAAGTGKTKLLKAIRNEVRMLFEDDACLVTTKTFTGAKAIDGATINSTFMIPIKSNGPWQASPSKKSSLEAKLKKAKILLIDCINFVEGQHVQTIDQKLRAVLHPQKPFGGLPVVLFGDLFQMPPINGSSVWKNPEVKNLWNLMKLEELTKNERVSDSDDIEFYDVLRSGGTILTKAVIDNLKIVCGMLGDTALDVVQELRKLRSENPGKTFAVLCNANLEVDKINEQIFESSGSRKMIGLKDPVEKGRFPTPQYNLTGRYEKKDLEVCIGSQVILTADLQLFPYGSIGKVKEITEDIVVVDFNNVSVPLSRRGWYQGGNGWKQFPLVLAEAFTFSSCQEINVDGVIVFGDVDEKSLYTVLSRARSLKLCRFTQVNVLDSLLRRDLEAEKTEMRRLRSNAN